jgi:cell wall-associated NlpC family hydrolase
MTSPVDGDLAPVSSRLAALQSRFGLGRSQHDGGASFEALLAQAGSRAGLEATRRPMGGARLGASLESLDGNGSAGAPTALASGGLTIPASSAGLHTLSSLHTLPGLLTADPGDTARSSAGEAVLDAARAHLGVPYLWGGTDPVKGFDCSGLVQDAYRQIGVEMPKWSRHQATMGVEVASIDDALPGDVLTFGQPVNHVALYVGDGQMLHAPRTGEVVKIEPINRTIASIRRIVEPGHQTVAGLSPLPGSASPVTVGGGGPLGVADALATNTSYATTAPSGERERRYHPLFVTIGQQRGIDPALLAAVAQTESGFRADAVSSAGAQGLMQFMPATAAEMGVDPWDPASAIDGAARYLLRSLDEFDTVEEAIASYNAGRGAVSRYGGIPPFAETQRYVEKVLDAWRSRS